MKTNIINSKTVKLGLALFLLFASGLILPRPLKAGDDRVIPPGSAVSGKTYGEWSAAFWKWAVELPVSRTVTRGGTTVTLTNPLLTPPAGAQFDVTEGQSGTVWFLASPIDSPTTVRNITIPAGTTLFVSLLNLVATDYGDGTQYYPVPTTYDIRLQQARDFVDPAVMLYFKIDGIEVGDLSGFRVTSPQFTCKAPNPNNSLLDTFGDSGVNPTVTAIADGYYVLVKPLAVGTHSIEFSWKLKATNSAPDETVTYNIIVK